ncbi:MAG: ABC-F family ATP-binding cassette domain-containing protein [Boseongicola sp.]
MARAPLLQLRDISLTFGGPPVFVALSLTVQAGDRLALVGRNGSGKSTLMKVMAGLQEPDHGTRVVSPGHSVGYMAQEPEMRGCATLGDYAIRDLGTSEFWRIEAVAQELKFDAATSVEAASGGERRRAALAKLIAEAPDLMLLDEPTNHLDIEATLWLENHLKSSRSAFIVISHDRALLRALSRGTLWIDRGNVRRQDKGFDAFEAWRDKVWSEEDEARHKLSRKIKAEAKWAVEGISARRRRNQGRLRALHAMRAERAEQIERTGAAAMELDAGKKSGKRVIEAFSLEKLIDGKLIVRDFSLRVARGDRVAFVGPNGVGKTTLIGMLTGQIAPDAGEVTLGSGLQMAVFDQRREALDPDATLWESLSGHKAMRVPGKADQVMVRGTPRHIVSYLKDFLFDETQARSPVKTLSGGEKARLLLAKLMAKPSNLLVLDEPTNDLDIETLDLLQELLDDYDGTVLLVSHDRDFLDRVATTTVAMEGNAQITVHAGGWSDYAPKRRLVGQGSNKPATVAKPQIRSEKPKKSGLTFTEKHRLETLPGKIKQLEEEIGKLETLLSDPELYTQDPSRFAKATDALADRQIKLSAAEDDWLTLEDKATG